MRPFRDCSSWRIARASPTRRRAHSSTRSPSVVNPRKRDPRSTRAVPRLRSRLFTAEENVGWLTPAASAARPKWRSLANSSRSSSLSSMGRSCPCPAPHGVACRTGTSPRPGPPSRTAAPCRQPRRQPIGPRPMDRVAPLWGLRDAIRQASPGYREEMLMRPAFAAAALAALLALAFCRAVDAQQLDRKQFNVAGTWSFLTNWQNLEQPLWAKDLPEASGGSITGNIKSITELNLKGTELLRLLKQGVFDVAA